MDRRTGIETRSGTEEQEQWQMDRDKRFRDSNRQSRIGKEGQADIDKD